ncbi:endolytic transglycosylase MltG [Homoserinibacter sp. YIM 151385]|uniref:endolytic transglycosylase MltG n=1 Tax=Homoserinibacter sp. YIM 151385 TaxID=2985506 RepID=UPI0022F0C4BA|nr:endolytic transglycosylase MltG [Homoserinibacter sp. YIM 151385]WBU38668.1 endolytic transglycosylase MltG [Homoserinibacter sp. YIM 151385]
MATEPSWDDIFQAQPEEPRARRSEAGRPAPGPVTGVAAAAAAASASRPLPSRRAAREEQDARAATRPPKPPRKRRWGWIVVLVLVLGALGGAGVAAWSLFEPQIREVLGIQLPNDYEGSGNGEEVDVTIVDGDIGGTIAQTLVDLDVTMTYQAFYDLLLEKEAAGEAPNFIPGTYTLQREMSAESALAALLDESNRRTATVQIPEGVVLARELELISAGTGLPLEELQAAAEDPADYGVDNPAGTLEGYLFPATWTFDPGVTPEQVIQQLVDRTVQELDEAGVPEKERHRVLTIASLVQREARLPDDFYKVSRVIQNRLKADMMLQFDSTSHYGADSTSGSVFTTDEERAAKNDYNTYQMTGLPIGPIAAPGATAIDAAMNPVDGSWLYFVAVNLESGETEFTNTIAEHEQAVAKLHAWCRSNPDYCG